MSRGGVTQSHLAAIQDVTAAMRMTVSDFLTEEVRGISPKQCESI